MFYLTACLCKEKRTKIKSAIQRTGCTRTIQSLTKCVDLRYSFFVNKLEVYISVVCNSLKYKLKNGQKVCFFTMQIFAQNPQILWKEKIFLTTFFFLKCMLCKKNFDISYLMSSNFKKVSTTPFMVRIM